MHNESLLSVREVAAKVSLSPSTIWDAVKRGTFPAPQKISDRVTRWRQSAVEAWIANPKLPPARTVAPPHPAKQS